MVDRIDHLTPEQEARISDWRDRWIAVGLSTERMDLPKFEAAARACYRYARLAEPSVVVAVPSPLVMALAAPIAAHILVRDTDRVAVGDAVGDAVGVAVGDAVRVAVRDAVRVAVGDAVGVAVGDAVHDAVRVAVGDARWRYLGGQFWVGGWWWGSPAHVSFFREVCGLRLPGDFDERALAWQATIESACWWWPHREFVMVSDRPLAISRDPEGRLHSEDGPAIVWSDGFGVWSWHGVRVSRELIEAPETITLEAVAAEANAEVRRVMIERYGRERLLDGAAMVGRDDFGTLWRRDFGAGREPWIVVEVINGTPEPDGEYHHYLLGVPPNFGGKGASVRVELRGKTVALPRTPLAAVAWTYGLRPEEYWVVGSMRT